MPSLNKSCDLCYYVENTENTVIEVNKSANPFLSSFYLEVSKVYLAAYHCLYQRQSYLD